LVSGDLEQVLLSDGGVEALAGAQGRGSTHAQEGGGEEDWFDHCR
jgi:hypothetical protein